MEYEINYEDERFKAVENEHENALTEHNATYDELIAGADTYYEDKAKEIDVWVKKQQDAQNELTDFAIDNIEQQKEQTHKEYLKEQSGAYTDWKKQSGQYGVNAEQMAAQGLANSGYSESSQVSMYNTYQNRVATARESYNRAVLNYENAIKEARLQNNSILAEIARDAFQQQLELSIQGFQYKNSLVLEKANKKQEIDDTYYNRYQDVLDQMNAENELAEEVRQFEAELKEKQRQFNDELAYEKWKDKLSTLNSQSNSGNASDETKDEEIYGGLNSRGLGLNAVYAINKDDTSSLPYVTTYEDAAKFLQSKGLTKGEGILMTQSEWASRKKRGYNGPETQYATYVEYINNYIAWKAENSVK